MIYTILYKIRVRYKDHVDWQYLSRVCLNRTDYQKTLYRLESDLDVKILGQWATEDLTA